MKRKSPVFTLVLFSIMLALEALVCFTPLGSLFAGTPIVATLSHIPVILTAVILGTGYGTVMGFFFGLFSFIVWTFMPPPASAAMAFLFTPLYSAGAYEGSVWSLVICFVPRILVGTVSGLCFAGLDRLKRLPQLAALAITGVLGSATNTVLVISGFYLFFAEQYAEIAGISVDSIMTGIIGVNGLMEAAVAALLAAAVGKAVLSFMRREKPVY